MWREFAQRPDERLFAIHDPLVGVQTAAPQLEQRELDVVRHVFHQENSERDVRPSQRSASGFSRRRVKDVLLKRSDPVLNGELHQRR